jgi:hypothetical protein
LNYVVCILRMDAKLSYVLKVKIIITATTMRKDVSRSCVDKVVDSDTVNHHDFVDGFDKQYQRSHNELLKMYYIDDCTYHQASSDQDMVQMLEKNQVPNILIFSSIFMVWMKTVNCILFHQTH